MGTPLAHRSLLGSLLAFLFISLLPARVQGQPRAHAAASSSTSTRIAFVTLALTDTSATVVRVMAVSGRLKPSSGPNAEHDRGVRFESVNDGAIVWTSTAPDPLRQRLEYVDASGALAATVVEHAEALVLVRIPDPAPRQQLRIFRTEPASGHAKATERLVARVEVVL